jgi:hypothetical protein
MPKPKRESVYELVRASRCHNCDSKLVPGALVRLQDLENDREALCGSCAGLANFSKVPIGNAALTRLASKYSEPCYVIMRWSELWKCYERQGVLVSDEALNKAKSELNIG